MFLASFTSEAAARRGRKGASGRNQISHGVNIAHRLLQDFGDGAGADGAAAFADRETQTLLHRDGRDQVDLQRHRVPGHHHLHPLRQLRCPRHVRRPEEKLRPVPVEERRVTAPLLLRQDVGLCRELHVRRNRSRLGAHLPTLHVLPLRPPKQQPNVVSRLALVQKLAEHLHSRHDLLLRRTDPHNLHLFSNLDHPTLHSPRHHRPSPRNRKHILNRHQKILVDRSLRYRNVTVPRLHRLQRRPLDDRYLIPRKPVRRQQLPHLQLHQLQKLRVVHHVRLVQKHHDVRHPNLTRQQYVLPRLRHRPVRRRHHQNRPVHLRRTRDHVLHVVRMTRTVHVRVVTLLRRILHVRRVDRNPTRLLLRRIVNLVVQLRRRQPLLGQYQRDRRRQCRLPVIHVTNRPDVHVRLAAIKLLFTHLSRFASAGLGTRDSFAPSPTPPSRFATPSCFSFPRPVSPVPSPVLWSPRPGLNW